MLIDALGQLFITGSACSNVEIRNFVVTKAVDVIVIQPHLIGAGEVVFAETLGEVASGAKSPGIPSVHQRTGRVWRSGCIGGIGVDAVVSKRGVYMLVNDVENDGDSARVGRVDQAFESLG